MKYFLKRTLFFLSSLILIFIINFLINRYIINKSDINLESCSVLIMGDSHVQYGVNPSYFENAQNISQPAEDYISTYWKLKKISNKFIPDTIILGYSYHNISSYNDLKYTDKRWSSAFFERLYAINEFSSLESIDVDFLEFYKVYFRELCLFPKIKPFKFIGGYKYGTKNDINDLEVAINKYFVHKNSILSFSENSINYLFKIINFCKDKNIKLILLTTPVHQSYYELVPNDIKKKHDSLKKEFIKDNISIIDYSRKKYNDSLFYNVDHLNGIGSQKMSLELIKNLK